LGRLAQTGRAATKKGRIYENRENHEKAACFTQRLRRGHGQKSGYRELPNLFTGEQISGEYAVHKLGITRQAGQADGRISRRSGEYPGNPGRRLWNIAKKWEIPRHSVIPNLAKCAQTGRAAIKMGGSTKIAKVTKGGHGSDKDYEGE
jgi:hypothetical protein